MSENIKFLTPDTISNLEFELRRNWWTCSKISFWNPLGPLLRRCGLGSPPANVLQRVFWKTFLLPACSVNTFRYRLFSAFNWLCEVWFRNMVKVFSFFPRHKWNVFAIHQLMFLLFVSSSVFQPCSVGDVSSTSRTRTVCVHILLRFPDNWSHRFSNEW